MMNSRATFAVAILLAFLLVPAAAQDTATIAAGDEGGRTRVGGRILDYTGRELRMNTAGGLEKAFPAEKVIAIETSYGEQHTAADGAFAAGRFDEALALYQKAVEAEPRRWVRRQIVAQWVWCYRALNRPDRAGEAFLLLVQDDPLTPYFDCIPLTWLPQQPSAAIEQIARGWINREEPAAVLLGASHLLTTRDRPAAVAKLRRLSAGADRRVAQLAMAQAWRASGGAVDDVQFDAMDRAIEQMPEPLRAGPYYVLGSMLLQQKQWERAAMAMMRVPILYPQHRALAARSLVDAARAMEQLGRNAEALRLVRELMGAYPEQSRAVAEATSRMQSILDTQQ